MKLIRTDTRACVRFIYFSVGLILPYIVWLKFMTEAEKKGKERVRQKTVSRGHKARGECEKCAKGRGCEEVTRVSWPVRKARDAMHFLPQREPVRGGGGA